MPNRDAIGWFKRQFHTDIEAATAGTPFTVDLLTAIACQETGYIWNRLRQRVNTDELLLLCVGDTLDADRGRRAFPKTKADLLASSDGELMFRIARESLEQMARHVPGYDSALRNPNKFCHGFGVFQYDLQFFRTDPDYFLQRRWASFSASLGKALDVLRVKLGKIGLADRSELGEMEMVAVAIAYNTGGYKPAKGLKQGHFDGTRYYGEAILDYLRLASTVPTDDVTPAALPAPPPGAAAVPPPTPVTASGRFYQVDVRLDPLNVRAEPRIPADGEPNNVRGRLPDGQIVRALTGQEVDSFLEIETSLHGALIRGWSAVRYLKAAPEATEVPVEAPAPAPPASGVIAVFMPLRTGAVTQRAAPATAHSLNEPGQPERHGESAEARREELAAIAHWLAVDDPAHKRYQPVQGATFCNVYAHDYCHLAGCYLPRVWWSAGAIEALARGQAVEPLLGRTIEEQRANSLFRWLRDFGLRFGWRQTGTATKLQTEVNQGAVGLVVARRVEDGRSGHITVVVPETDEHRARRDAQGEVLAPLQSQAGTTNFRYGTGKAGWWRDPRFAEFAFWLHP